MIRSLLVPWLIGLALSMLQVCLFTGFGPIFHSTELPYQMVTVALLLGHALGYAWPPASIAPLALLCVMSPGLLLAFRGVSPALDVPAQAWALPASAVLASLATASLASLTLVWYSRSQPSPTALAQLYSAEMLGSASGLLLAGVLGVREAMDWFPYFAAGAFIGCGYRWLGGVAVLMAAVQSVFLSDIEAWAVQRVYVRPGLGTVKILEHSYSPYQLIEVVSFNGQPFLFLNGLCHHNPKELAALNYYLAELPAELLDDASRSRGALVLGGGALLSPAETIRRGLETTVVELDQKVLEISARQFASEFGLDTNSPKFHLVADDARHYARREHTYGLIVFSLPYPYSINVASLFTREFFQLLRQRLSPTGCMAVFIGAPAREPGLDRVSAAILRALRQSFPHAVAIRSRESDNMVVLVTQHNPLDLGDVERQLRKDGRYGYQLLTGRDLDNLASRSKAASLWDLRTCGWLNLRLWLSP